ELMQAAEFTDEFVARTQVKMIGIREDDFRAEFFEGFLGERFDRSLRADRHKEWSFDGAVGRGETAAASTGRAGLQNLEGKHSFSSVSRENPSEHREEENESEPH